MTDPVIDSWRTTLPCTRAEAEAIDAGGLNPQHGAAAQDTYRQLVKRYETIMPLASAVVR